MSSAAGVMPSVGLQVWLPGKRFIYTKENSPAHPATFSPVQLAEIRINNLYLEKVIENAWLTFLLNSSVQSFCPSAFQSGIWWCFLGVPEILGPRSVSATENPLRRYTFQWKIPEISLGSSPLGLMVLSLTEVIQEPILPQWCFSF